jgi:hypothetical protein
MMIVTSAWGQATVTGTTLVSSTRVGRTLFDYNYTVTVKNGAPGIGAATVTVASHSPATVILKGTVQLGDLSADTTTVSTDVFTIQQDRTVPFGPDTLSFTVQGITTTSTSFALIDQALANGTLNLETAIEYKVFAMFRDPRLPARFHGDDSAVFESDALSLVVQNWSTLSAAAQKILQPFLMPPAYVGSWYSPAATAATHATASDAQSSTGTPWLCNAPEIDPNWAAFPATPFGHAKVWYDTRNTGDFDKAVAVWHAIQDDIWPALIDALGFKKPVPDGALGGCNGGDGRLDVYLAEIAVDAYASDALGQALPLDFTRGPKPVFIGVRPSLPPNTLKGVVAHEFMHASQAAYKVATGNYVVPDYKWLAESTAEWAIDAVYPKLPDDLYRSGGDVEQVSAPDFMDHPEQSLEDRSTGLDHMYGSYLFFQFLARTLSPSVVAQIWEATTKQTKELLAVDSSIPGGFKQQWRDFAKLLWNEDPVKNQSFFHWDNLTLTPALVGHFPNIVTLEGQPGRVVFLDGNIKHLATRYYQFHFGDPNIRSLGFLNNPYAVEPIPGYDATTQVFYMIQGGSWQPALWSDKTQAQKFFCLDIGAQRITDLVIVMSNDTPDATKDITDLTAQNQPRVSVSSVGCWQYKGMTSVTTESSVQGAGSSSTTANASVVWLLSASASGSPGVADFSVKSGFVTGNSSSDYAVACKLTSSGKGNIPTPSPNNLHVDLGLDYGEKISRLASGSGSSSEPTTSTNVCPQTPPSTTTAPMDWTWMAFPEGGVNVKPDGTISGSITVPLAPPDSGTNTMTWSLSPIRQ